MSKKKWRNRIVEYGSVDPNDLLANPRNWRIHPKQQQEALAHVLEKVGWVDDVVVNKKTGFVVDGHLRIAMALRNEETEVPVKFVDLTEEEESLILATLDPIASMAATDSAKLEALAAEIATYDEESLAMLRTMAAEGALKRTASLITQKPDELAKLTLDIEAVRHIVEAGEVYELGTHLLLIMDPLLEWEKIAGYCMRLQETTGKVVWLAAYAGPMLGLVETNDAIVMVQPEAFIAGHILDLFEDYNGPESVRRA